MFPLFTYMPRSPLLQKQAAFERPRLALSKDLMLMKRVERGSIEPLALRPLQRNKTWEQPSAGIQLALMYSEAFSL